MKKIISFLVLISFSIVICTAQYSTIKTPTNTSVESINNSEASASWLALWENDAADWIDDNNSNATRIGPASYTYNCHCYTWHSSDGGNKDWVNKNDQYSTANVAKYWSGYTPTYSATNRAKGTKVFLSTGDHSMKSTSTSGV